MRFLHICNTYFEWELLQAKTPSLAQAMNSHPVFRKLQYIPLYYADPSDGVLVTAPPSGQWLPRIHLTHDPLPSYDAIIDWGASPAIAAWAKAHDIPYSMPPWECVRAVHSKAFAHELCPLPGSALLWNTSDLEQFKPRGPVVYKQCIEAAGRGLLVNPTPVQLASFCARAWKQGQPVIAQPWKKRLVDFSTQWRISKEGAIDYLGVTICKNNARGQYLGSEVGMEMEPPPEHRLALKEMHTRGFFGNVGIDAFTYDEDGMEKLHPICEINARKTMGWLALELQKRMQKPLSIHFEKPDWTLRISTTE